MSNSTYIPGWYAILQSPALKKKPINITRFELSLALWRDTNGIAHCMIDRCPHRGAKLSIGNIKNNCIECPYHGFRFNQDGLCEHAPEFNKPIPGLTVQTFKIKEAMGMIWLAYQCPSAEFNYDTLNNIHQLFSNGYSESSHIWHSHITYCIENQLDFTHLPNVHKNTIGRSFQYPKEPHFNLNADQISISLDGKQTAALTYFFPNTWILNISQSMKLLVYFAPINQTKTKLYLRSYHKSLKFKPSKKLLSIVFNKINSLILKQDETVVRSQGLLPSYLAKNDTLMKNDQAIKYFRTYWESKINKESK